MYDADKDYVLEKMGLNQSSYEMKDGIVKLFHGSKGGIKGKIRPLSRECCDFGKGFYMGTTSIQPLTLISGYSNSKLYEVEIDLKNLSILNLELGIDWALLVAYNRGALKDFSNSSVYKYCENIMSSYDMVTGCIADDNMFVVLNRFLKGEITDVALIKSLSVLNLGKQYVAITQKACDKIVIVSERSVPEEVRKFFIEESDKNRTLGVLLADNICRNYRRRGRYLDEILKEGL